MCDSLLCTTRVSGEVEAESDEDDDDDDDCKKGSMDEVRIPEVICPVHMLAITNIDRLV